MSELPTWPHLENLDRVLKDYPDYLTGDENLPGFAAYTVTEKLHGFNARFGRDNDGSPWIGSRNQIVARGTDPAAQDSVVSIDGTQLQGFVGFAKRTVGKLLPGETLFGEWAGKGVQKGIDYGERDFYAFGAMQDGLLAPFETVQAIAEQLGCKVVPILGRYFTVPPSGEELSALRIRKSRLAEQDAEGIVVYPFPCYLDKFGRPLIAKYKAPSFEERTRFRRVEGVAPDLTVVTGFADEYVNEGRLDHVLWQVIETEGPIDPLDARFTGQVMRAMYEDVIREGAADFALLTDADRKQAGKVINRKTKEVLDSAREKAMLSLAKEVPA